MSYRTDTTAGYDQSLLSSVPDPTRAEKQEGYNVGLLQEAHDRRPPTPPNGVVPDQSGTTLDYSPGAISYARKREPPDPRYESIAQAVPWYRWRWGIVGIVVVALLIIGGAVGGAVGGTQHSSHANKTDNGTSHNGTGGGSNGTAGGNGANSVGQGTQGNATATSPTDATRI